MTSKLAQVQEELAQLKTLLARAGIGTPAPAILDAKDRADYIEFGSEKHAAILGLVEAQPDDEKLYIIHKGGNGKTYRLEDEITAYVHHHDPRQVALLTLRQKINTLEAGKPPIPDSAPPLWTPVSREGVTWTQLARQGV